MSLELATLEELVDELGKRGTNMVFQIDGVPVSGLPEGTIRVYRKQKGEPTYCLGMTVQLQKYVLEHLIETDPVDPSEHVES